MHLGKIESEFIKNLLDITDLIWRKIITVCRKYAAEKNGLYRLL